MKSKIKVGIIGVGNCASALIQGFHYYRSVDPKEAIGLSHWKIGQFEPGDIEVVSAFDIDKRKVGQDLSVAMFALPNCTTVFNPDIAHLGVTVKMGNVLDGCPAHMNNYADSRSFRAADEPDATQEDIVGELISSGTEILINYLPVGSEKAGRFYAQCALEAGVAFINCVPIFIASDPFWAEQFKAKNIPIIGDDIKSQFGATITHRILADLFKKRGVKLERTYQLNTGGNTDFLNMLDIDRLRSKKESKTEAVQAVVSERMTDENIHVGPSDYVPWQRDNKVCFIRMEGKLFGDIPMNLEMRLSVEDSPNSAGVVIDAIRFCKQALIHGIGGVLIAPSAYFMKHPPVQFTDDEAYVNLEKFNADLAERVKQNMNQTVSV